MSKELH